MAPIGPTSRELFLSGQAIHGTGAYIFFMFSVATPPVNKFSTIKF